MHVYRADVTFLIPIEEMDFFSFVSLFCAVLLLYYVISVSKGSNNNTLISIESLCDFYVVK